MRVLAILLLGCALAIFEHACNEAKTVSLSEVAQHAAEQSTLTLPGSAPFHLKAKIVETTNPDSDYKAEIEEYWLSPTKWRRTIESPDFSQTLIVNGDTVSEQNKGYYYPWWLSDLVTAIFDPLPTLEQVKQLHAEIEQPSGSERPETCADLKTSIDRTVFCFENSHGLLTSAFTQRGYDANFSAFKDFKDKHVARRIVIDPEPGTTIEARITELQELNNPEEILFAVQQTTPVADRIRSVKLDEIAARGLLVSNPDITWPTVGNGLTQGRCAVYISVDRSGKTQEVWPEGCDNPGLEDPLRDQVRKWEFRPATQNGVPVQAEAFVTFEFQTSIDASKTKPVLSNAEARKLATHVVKPVFQAGSHAAQTIEVRISVDEQGKVIGISNPGNIPTNLFMNAMNALTKWTFRPYVKDGKPVVFDADIVLSVE